MKYFLKYLKKNSDDSPLYVFDSNYDNDSVSKRLLNDYNIPTFFPDDLFELVGESKRPPYRWFLTGPERSGTCVHIDPLGTSAWNTVVEGRKRWVVFKPRIPKDIVKGKDVILKGEDDEAINYFLDIVPRIKKKYTDIEVLEFTQMPGDTVFIPGGWWHAVLNLDNTIAITQNFCSRTNFERVWVKTRSGRKKMAVKWLKLLDEKYPQLAMAARQLNEEDDFVMYKSKKDKKDKKKTSEKNDRSDTDDDDDDDGETTHDRDCRDSDSVSQKLKRSGSDDSSTKTSKYQRI
jgi:histone arginine demethylase JMJD6